MSLSSIKNVRFINSANFTRLPVTSPSIKAVNIVALVAILLFALPVTFLLINYCERSPSVVDIHHNHQGWPFELASPISGQLWHQPPHKPGIIDLNWRESSFCTQISLLYLASHFIVGLMPIS